MTMTDSHPLGSRQTWSTRRIILAALIITLTFLCFTLNPYDQIVALAYSQPSRPTILILQQIHTTWLPDENDEKYELEVMRKKLYTASEEAHRIYAAIWNYGYAQDSTDYASYKGGRHFMNKMWTLIEAMESELSLPEEDRHQWIFMTDADTLIVDPSIPLTTFLPPGDPASIYYKSPDPPPSPLPMMMATQDGNGFNSGAVFWRIHSRTLQYLHHAMNVEHDVHESSGVDPTDQHLIAYTMQLQSEADFAAAFYEVPFKWINSYFIDDDEGSQRWHGDEGVTVTPQLQIHLPNKRWFYKLPNWEAAVVDVTSEIYRQAWHTGGGLGELTPWTAETAEQWRQEQAPTVLKGLRRSGSWHTSAVTANRWWSRVHSGIGNITWNTW